MIDLQNKKILLVRNDNIGDLICTTPAIEALRKAYPNNKIDIVVNSYNYDVIATNPYINKIYCYTKPKHKKNFFDKLKAGLGKLKILLDIRKERYDVVIVFRSDYSKSAELFSDISNAPHRIGVKSPKNNDNFTTHIKFNHNMHEVEFCFECLNPFGIQYKQELTRFDPEKNCFNDKYKKYQDYLTFHISARMKPNQYPKESFEYIFENICKIYPKILLTAEPKDFQIAQELSSQYHITFIKTQSLLDYANLLRQTYGLVTLEGGSMHLGPALEIPTIAIFGISPIERWHPWGYKNLVLQTSSHCAKDINPSQIISIIKKTFKVKQ
jgi:ADP-heptose:LPS heptosyltransferase